MLPVRTLAQQLGMPLGKTLEALARSASEVAPDAPSEAFAALWLILPWLEKGERAASIPPSDLRVKPYVHPFAKTGGDLGWFGFLVDEDDLESAKADDLPVVFVRPSEEEEHTEVVAPDLASFLGLVATAYADIASRDLTDAEWKKARQQDYADDPERLAEMDRLADVLCTIPSVARPESPARVAKAAKNRRFVLEDVEPTSEERETFSLGDVISSERDRILSLSTGMVDGACLDAETLKREKSAAKKRLNDALDALARHDAAAARERVAEWKKEPMLWKVLAPYLAKEAR